MYRRDKERKEINRLLVSSIRNSTNASTMKYATVMSIIPIYLMVKIQDVTKFSPHVRVIQKTEYFISAIDLIV